MTCTICGTPVRIEYTVQANEAAVFHAPVLTRDERHALAMVGKSGPTFDHKAVVA